MEGQDSRAEIGKQPTKQAGGAPWGSGGLRRPGSSGPLETGSPPTPTLLVAWPGLQGPHGPMPSRCGLCLPSSPLPVCTKPAKPKPAFPSSKKPTGTVAPRDFSRLLFAALQPHGSVMQGLCSKCHAQKFSVPSFYLDVKFSSLSSSLPSPPRPHGMCTKKLP